MVDSEDITLERIKTKELSLGINTLSNTFQQNTTIQDTPPEPPQMQAVDPNNKSKPQYKKYCIEKDSWSLIVKKSKLLMMIKTINLFIMDTPYLVFMMMVFANQLF